ncbi:fimbrial outer membrane usher protein [Enterobacter sp. KBR-315C3_2022]|uniref:fimbrial outer membrane usher protein n=1 Tax=Enterobacter sp. KBR-315C3_2022 TaxID=3242494 RepID=UPI003527F1A8
MRLAKRKNHLTIQCLYASLSAVSCSPAAARDYYFDPALLQGSGVAVNLSLMNEKEIPVQAGDYNPDLYVNNKLVKQNTLMRFSPAGKDSEVQPCLTIDDIRLSRLKPGRLPALLPEQACYALGDISPGSSWEFDQPALRLNLQIPQASLNRQPRGFIPVDEWDQGIAALFFKHNSNYYETRNDGGYRTKNFWSGITSGTNIGLWQLRNQSNYRYMETNQRTRQDWTSIKTYAQRPLPALNSVITLGDSYTNSSLFGSLSFNGIKLASDVKMYPQSRRGYAPEIRGMANTTARVIVRQLGKTIYETVVAPGPFLISDLNNTRGQGNLQVTVVEATGQQSTFTVTYSAVPESVRPGVWNYELALGRVRNYGNTDNEFLEGVIQRGVSNALTANAGVRLAKDYQAFLTGGVLATAWGAFGLNATYSDALVENDNRQTGWRAEGSYSRTFSTGTNIMLAAYRYSTQGFRDLQDVLGVRRYTSKGETYYSDTLNQKNQLSATVSQGMGSYGSLSLNASTSDYYNNKSRITQFQLGYANSYGKLSYSINIGRQRTTYSTRRYYYDASDISDNRQKYNENTASVSFSVPLDWGQRRSSVTYNYSRNKTSETSTAAVSGSAGEAGQVSYSLYGGMERYKDEGNTATWGGSLQNNTAKGAWRASYSQGSGYKQLGLGTSGTLVMHSGGLTYGPYASDTFALVHARGATGAAVKNGQGAKIDSLGYAILPSLTPYRYNNVSLDPKEMSEDVELAGGSRQVVPYAGAVVGVRFDTVYGKQVLINSALSGGKTVPMGAEVRDRDGNVIGMVGQAGQVYARLDAQSGTLFVSWGEEESDRCQINYQLPTRKIKDRIIELDAPCAKTLGEQ